MIVLCHRGWWLARHEQNGEAAFRRALAAGFGIETDLRDRDRGVVIAHDPPGPDAIPVERLLDLAVEALDGGPLALNVKADGLQGPLQDALRDRPTLDWFLFDMSIPAMLGYRRRGMPYFTRESEVEPEPALYGDAAGVWMDQFFDDWIDADWISRHLDAGKRVAIVSPELHGRDHRGFWDRLSRVPAARDARVMLCTDFPDRARDLFDA